MTSVPGFRSQQGMTANKGISVGRRMDCKEVVIIMMGTVVGR